MVAVLGFSFNSTTQSVECSCGFRGPWILGDLKAAPHMHVTQIQHSAENGWSAPMPAELDGPSTLVLAFGPSCAADVVRPLADLAVAFPNSVLMGCSSAGEMLGEVVNDGTLSVAVARFDRTSLAFASTTLVDADDSWHAGMRLAEQLDPVGLRAVFLLSCGLNVNGGAVVRGLTNLLPDGVIVSGGLAGDGSRFEETWVLEYGALATRGVAAVGFYGEALQVSHGCDSGWKDFGPERLVTRSEGSELFELDGQPALALYKEYLGELASQLPGSALLFPLSVRLDQPGARAVVRTILGLDEQRQSLTFGGDMPLGSIARLMRTSVDSLVTCAEDAADVAMADLGEVRPGAPVLAVSVSCIGRRLVMGERTDEEVEAVADRLPFGSAHTGFYSYGEIAPANGDSRAELHNQTMTITVFAEV